MSAAAFTAVCRACWLMAQPIAAQRTPAVLAQWRARPALYCHGHRQEVAMVVARMRSAAYRMAETTVTPRQVREDMTGIWGGKPW